jgi:hypothetical protein
LRRSGNDLPAAASGGLAKENRERDNRVLFLSRWIMTNRRTHDTTDTLQARLGDSDQNWQFQTTRLATLASDTVEPGREAEKVALGSRLVNSPEDHSDGRHRLDWQGERTALRNLE